MNVVDKIYDEYEDRRLEKANQFLTNLFISRFADLLGAVGGLNAIESSKTLNDDLQKDRLLNPLGILFGGITTSKHIYDHMGKTANEAGHKEEVGHKGEAGEPAV